MSETLAPSETRSQIIVGLEIHVQLTTQSKIFSGCGTAFGLPPNTQTDPVSLGLPGTLPVMNRDAFDLALMTALAFECEITRFTKWDRKNYYYPDLPKNYQISQYDLPFSTGGWLPVPGDGPEPARCRLTRIHLEEDTGKMIHGSVGQSEVDMNRAGIPLMEIVTEPDLRSAAEARACLEELRLTLRYLGVSDCEMQEGSLRCDANVNLRIEGPEIQNSVATPIVEIKNLNSFRSVERAIQYEAQRQFAQWKADGVTISPTNKQTRGWNEEEGVTKLQRTKETAADYRYFPEPDLVPVVVDEVWLERIRGRIGELPQARRGRFRDTFGLSEYDAGVLVEQGRDTADYFEEVVRLSGEPKLASNWIQQDVLRAINEQKLTIDTFPIRPDVLAKLIGKVRDRQLSTGQGREVLGKLIAGEGALDQIIEAGGYQMVSDESAISAAITSALEDNPKAIKDLTGGKKKPEAVKGFLRGQVMKRTGGKADPKLVGELLEAKLNAIMAEQGNPPEA